MMETIYTQVSVRVDKKKREQIKQMGLTLPEVMDKAFNDILINNTTGADKLKIQYDDLTTQLEKEEQEQLVRLAEYDAGIMDLKEKLHNLEDKKSAYLEKSNALIQDLNNRISVVNDNLNQEQFNNQEQEDYNRLFDLCNTIIGDWQDHQEFMELLNHYCTNYNQDKNATFDKLVEDYNNQFL